jgi:hypothetical protein
MIVTVGMAKQTRCPEDIGKGNGNCQATDCMAWEFWLPPPEMAMKERPLHGIKNRDKKGYCGKSIRR